ncbi:MAG: GNAT family N-acetyltransferase [Bryobacteraceae bacterium]|nr:GNAT family N-acetyltransferase [Bryobacteraceae bacterium]MDW8380212.1 GNAT family N-acetyltransferase [Bryobacterales bacterium]
MKDYELVNENLRCALAAFANVGPAGCLERREGFQLVYCGAPFGLFNTVNLARPPERGEFEEILRQARAWFSRFETPWSIWFCDDFFDPVQRRRSRISLATAGLRKAIDAPGMIAPQLLPANRSLPALDCCCVGDERTRQDFAQLMSLAFQAPEGLAQAVYGSESLWRGPIQGWIAYAFGSAVSAAAIVIGGGSIGVYAVATHPLFQRQGFGEAVVRHAVEEASKRTGIQRSVLQSSAMGYRLYARLGYRQAGRFLVYSHS